MSLIRNADDFGKNEDVTRAILTCFANGSIDRTTLMVNMPDAARAVEEAKKAGLQDRVGIHLNLTEGMPLSEPIRSNPVFCDENGRFHARFRQKKLYRLHMDRETEEQIYTELGAQLALYREWGLKLFHVDSHHHVHTDLTVYKALKRLAVEYRFSSVRISRNLYRGGSPANRIYKGWYNRAVRGLCESTTDLFGSFIDLKEYATPEENRDLIASRPVEIMMHPMYDASGTLTDTDTPMETVDAYFAQIR
ncbi:MAG: ChbG/HpnK family deacetylase [Lachnospiraceae bacterium]|nr:ChbG/HpnK family deacetylase [Lachnospiraceae bacterium]